MKKTLIISILIVLFMGWLSNKVEAASLESMQKIFNEARSLCTLGVTYCEPHLVISNQLQAVTRKEKDIYITSGLVKLLDEDELRAVVYHEVGHAVLHHSSREAKFLITTAANGTYTKELHSELRHRHEYEADRYASYTLKLTHQTNKLTEALTKIVPQQYWSVDFFTHPSNIKRSHRIRTIIEGGIN